jgi:hypothetical protein
MNKNLLWISALLTVTAGINTAPAAEKLGEHPAVIVARNWSARSVDPNTFIVAHPARLQLVAKSPSEVSPSEVSPSDKPLKVAEAEATGAAGQ